MRHTIQLLLACALLIGGAHCVLADPDGQGFQDDNWYERPDAPDLKDDRLVEHLSDPDAQGRAHAGLYLQQRWAGPKYVELLKADWQAGVIALDYWPKTDAEPLIRYLLTVTRTSPQDREDAACLLAEHTTGDQIYNYTGPIRDRALDLWVQNWLTELPLNIADPSYIWFAGTTWRRWLREYVYKDGSWTAKWGSFAWGTPWRLTEFRAVLALYSGDLDRFDATLLGRIGWLTALKESLATGKCAADVEMDDSAPKDVVDRLTSSTQYEDFGGLRYAELLCVVCDRPDWLLRVRARLQKATITTVEWIVDPKNPKAPGIPTPKQVVRDISTPLVYALALASLGKYDEFFTTLDEYLHQKWSGYETDTVPRAVWLTHPWMQNAIRDKKFQEKWAELTIPLDWPVK